MIPSTRTASFRGTARATALVLAFAFFLLGSCGGGGTGSASTSVPDAPNALVAIEDDAAITLTWPSVSGASAYDIYWSMGASVAPTSGTPIPDVTSPYAHTGLVNGQMYSYVVLARNANGSSAPSPTASATPVANVGTRYDPSWSTATPTATIVADFDGAQSSAQNGMRLFTAIGALQPGERLAVGAGTWTLPAGARFEPQGTVDFPIWIASVSAGAAVLTSADQSQPVLGIGGLGAGPTARYVCVRGFEITGGGVGLDVGKATETWIDRCHVHGTNGAGIHATQADSDHVHITRCDIHDTASWGEGMLIGDDNVGVFVHHFVIALNDIHDTRNAIDGDGIRLRDGSWANWIAENTVHQTKYPAILFEGTNGHTPNLIERNICWDTLDNVMQAEKGEAIVRNNLLAGPCVNKIFDSTHNVAQLHDLVVVNNTMFAQAGYAAGLFGWNGQSNLVFANNVVYSNPVGTTGYAIAYHPGYTGGLLVNNVIIGYTPNVPAGGFTAGIGLSDFASVSTWAHVFTSAADFEPNPNGAIAGAASAAWVPTTDLFGTLRTAPFEAGAIELP